MKQAPDTNRILSFISKRHGKYYASLVAVHDGAAPTVAIMGPYPTERKAEKQSNKWMRLNGKRMKRGESVVLVGMNTVPEDVRVFITNDIRAAIAQYGADTLPTGVFMRARMQ